MEQLSETITAAAFGLACVAFAVVPAMRFIVDHAGLITAALHGSF